MPDVALLPAQRIKRQARKRSIQTLFVALAVGLVCSLIVAAAIYWFYQAGRFRH